MSNRYEIVTQEEKNNIKIVDNKKDFYLDINGTKLRNIKKYNIIREGGQPPILEVYLFLDEIDFDEQMSCQTS